MRGIQALRAGMYEPMFVFRWRVPVEDSCVAHVCRPTSIDVVSNYASDCYWPRR